MDLSSNRWLRSSREPGPFLGQTLTTAFSLLLQSASKKLLVFDRLSLCLCDPLLLFSNLCSLPLQGQGSDQPLNLGSFTDLLSCIGGKHHQAHNQNRQS